MASSSRVVEPSPARQPDFAAHLQRWQARVENELSARLPAVNTQPMRLHEAIRYSVLGGGKRVRPALVYATGAALGIDESNLDGAACAVELIHAYSLVHDDLPAMDDDDLRRGRPTCHKAFDEATAILVGDSLLTLAFEVVARHQRPAEAAVGCLRALAEASGAVGMVGGQMADLQAEGRTDATLEGLEAIHRRKTGA